MAGPFSNPQYSAAPPPGQEYWGGIPASNPGHPGGQTGHGHALPGQTPRLPVADFLGNAALQGNVRIPGVPTPHW